MDGWTSKMDRMVVEGERDLESRRVSMTRIGYLPHTSKSGRFQSPTVDVSLIYEVQILAVLKSRNHIFELLAIGACPNQYDRSLSS